MRVTYDREADAAYISFYGRMPILVASTIVADSGIIIDYDVEGKMCGIEVLQARSRLHESVLEKALIRD